MEILKREIHISPAFDKRSSDPSKNYGIHGVELCFILKGEQGAIQFVIYTNWMLPHVREEYDLKTNHHLCHPIPADIGYHSRTPKYEGQKSLTDDCTVIGGACYYDGSGLQAEDVFNIMVEKGGDAMWAEMEDRYNQLFNRMRYCDGTG